jgi:hypothetical protein
LERSKYRWEDNIKTEKEIGWKSVDSFDLAWDKEKWQAHVKTDLHVLYNTGNFCSRSGNVSFSRKNQLHAESEKVSDWVNEWVKEKERESEQTIELVS